GPPIMVQSDPVAERGIRCSLRFALGDHWGLRDDDRDERLALVDSDAPVRIFADADFPVRALFAARGFPDAVFEALFDAPDRGLAALDGGRFFVPTRSGSSALPVSRFHSS